MVHSPTPLTRFLTAPVFDDPERQRTASMLQSIFVGSFVIMVPVLLLTAFFTPMPHTILVLQGLLMLGAVVGVSLVWSGRLRVASIGFTVLIWLVVTISAAMYGGVRAPSLVGYPVVVLMAGFFLGRRAAVVTAVLSALAAAGLVWADGAQLLAVRAPTLMRHWLGVTGGLAGVGLFMHIGLRVDEERRATAVRLRLALEAGQVGTWEWDVDSDRVVWSDNMDAILGRRRTSLDGTHSSYLELVHEDDRLTVEHALRATIEERVPFAVDHRIRRPDGTIRWVSGRGEISQSRPAQSTYLVGTISDVTERRAAQERLEQSQHQLAEAQRLAKLGSWEWNLENNTVVWSDEFRRMYGAYEDPPSLERFREHVHPEDVGVADQAVAAVLERGEALDIHHRVVRSDDTTGVIHVRGELVRDAEGSAIKMMGFAQDVTELWQTEQALRESEAQYRTLFELSPVGIGFAEVGGRILAFNDAILEPGGQARSDITPSTTVDELYHDSDDITRVRSLLEQQGFVRDEEVKFKRKDGGFYEALLSVNPVTLKGRPCALAIVQDISARKRAEQALRASEERFRAIYEQAAISIVQAEPDGKFVGANPRFCELLGYTEAQLQTMLLRDVTHPDDRAADEANLASALVGEQSTFSVEKRYIHANGSVVWTELSATLVTNVDGGTPYWIGAITDITERKRAEEALRRANRALRVASHCNEAVIYAVSEQRLLQDLCHILVDDGGYLMAWVGLARDDEDKTVQPMTWAGVEDGYLDTTRISWADSALGRGPTGTAIRSGEPVVCRDILNDPQFAPWRDDAVRRGYQALIALPLQLSGKQAGALNIYANDPASFDTAEVQLLMDASREVAHGIGVLDVRREHDAAVRAVEQREERLRQALNAAGAGAWEWDVQTDEVSWSDENYYLLGLDPSVGPAGYQRWFERVHPDDQAAAEIRVADALERREDLNIEFRIVRPDGTVRWINDVGRLRFDENGEPSAMYGIQIDITERRATENAVRRSREQLRRLAARLQEVREEERTAIAREIHDELGQALTGMKMDLSWLIGRLPRTWKRAHARADELQHLVDDTITSVRDLSARLRPSVLDDLGLDAAIEWLAQDVERRADLQIHVNGGLGDTLLVRDRATALFRIVQEALTNVVRHAEASKVDIRLSAADDMVVVEITDDGKGMHGNELDSGTSLGLIGMRERAGALGGRVTFAKGANGGTVVTARIPMDEDVFST
jgi:PAS domain S-box-containing protein